MSPLFRVCFIACASACCALLVRAHAPPIPVPIPPFHVQGRGLFDSKGTYFEITGVQMPGLDARKQ